jgi:heme/copper-type cytochrome/quinol oxidase subunit 3
MPEVDSKPIVTDVPLQATYFCAKGVHVVHVVCAVSFIDKQNKRQKKIMVSGFN